MTQKETKLPCPFCKEKRAEKIRFNGTYVVSKDQKNDDGSFGITVRRFRCGSCGEEYTKHTNFENAYNHGYTERPKRRKLRLRQVKYDARNEGEYFQKKKSHHNEKKEKALFQKIDQAIIRRGFLEVEKMKKFLGIGTTTYYRYLKRLSLIPFGNEETPAIKKGIEFTNGLLIELKTKLQIDPTKNQTTEARRETSRVFILFDKDTHLAFDFFVVRKKKYRSAFSGWQPEKDLVFFGHSYSTPQLVHYLKLLKVRFPSLIVEMDCGAQTQTTLLSSAPEIFKKSRSGFTVFWRDLEKFKLRRNLTFSWTLTGKKLEENPRAYISQVSDLIIQINTLLSIYNRHHLVRLEKKGVNLRSKSIEPTSAPRATAKTSVD
jgi:hypothetical protein